MSEVSEYNKLTGRGLWVTYRDGVYNVTDFVKNHPGGAKFLEEVAGGPIDTLWSNWKYHHASPKVGKWLRRLRVGRLSDWDGELAGDELYEEEPLEERGQSQLILIDTPYNSETRTTALAQSYLTPTEDLYVRNHAPVPELDWETHRLTIQQKFDGKKTETIADFSLEEIVERFPDRDVTCVLQCAGNRAGDNRAMNGPNEWCGTSFETMGCGMVGNAKWGGTDLFSVLRSVFSEESLRMDQAAGKWVEFHGADEYFTSVPLSLLLERSDNCVLSTHLNGEILSRDHGFPLRVILPGIVGARNVKWVTKIMLRDGEGTSPWNVNYYKDTMRPMDETTKTYPSVQQLPQRQCLILSPNDAPKDAPGSSHFIISNKKDLEVSGVAYSNGKESGVSEVEVSSDHGTTWHTSTIATKPENDEWGWSQWTVRMQNPCFVPGLREPYQIWCRVKTKDGVVQSEEGDNGGGVYLYNGYHKVPVICKGCVSCDDNAPLCVPICK